MATTKKESAKPQGMYVVKRDGREESVSFDKITSRLKKLSWGLAAEVDPVYVTQKVVSGVYKGVTTKQLDELAAQTCAHSVTTHPDYGKLAARITVSNIHKHTKKSFLEVVEDLHKYINPKTGKNGPLIADDVYEIIMNNKDKLMSAISYDRDYNYDYFGIMTLMRAYLLKINGQIAERPQHMLMRVSIGIHKDDIDAAIQTYDYMSNLVFTHASPTMFNAGTPRPQMSSCFLLTMDSDSIDGIYGTLSKCAQISKNAGGIGVSIHKIRAKGSYIRGTNGVSNGLVPMLRVFNNTARYVDQGGGKRKGSFAMYLEPWHADIFHFLELRKNHGKEEERARDLFYAMWIPDLFMKRVAADGNWTLMCPNECPGLADVWGEKFEQLYKQYEAQGKGRKTIKAREVWGAILQSQIETGTPYMLYKDACNRKSNQQNLGTIRSSNLCCEIIEYSAPDEVAVCNLASIALPKFVEQPESTDDEKSPATVTYSFEKLKQVTKVIVRNLNRIIDNNYYPIEEARRSNMRHRPIGVGVQGLADVFMLMDMAWETPEAEQLNRDIFEAIYFGACEASMEIAKENGKPYETWDGCPASKGQLQFDMWGVTPSDRWDWAGLKEKIAKHGMYNSLLCAPMPTASTSQILGNNECFEPYTSNVYIRRTLAGEFVVINKHLVLDLIARGKWSTEVKQQLIAANGSVQHLPLDQQTRNKYKTVWEISQKQLIKMAASRGAFIDQSQSFNVHMSNVTMKKLTSMHFYGWKQGLKTGQYYLRTQAAADAIKFTVDQKSLKEVAEKKLQGMKQAQAKAEEDECLMCGS